VLLVTAFDDVVRARVGDVVLEVPRGALRSGRLALVSDGPGTFGALTVDAIEAYQFQATTSRYSSFEEHLACWDQRVHTLPIDTAGAAALLASTAADIHTAMASGDSQVRQRIFDRWTSQLALPLQSQPPCVQLAGDARLLLLESPEPLPFSRDVQLAVTRTLTGFPVDVTGVPPEWLALASRLEFNRNSVRALVPAELVDALWPARRLVHAVADRLTRRIRYEVYAVALLLERQRPVLQGVLSDTVTDLGRSRLQPPISSAHAVRIPVGHFAIFDGTGGLLGPACPLPVTTTATVNVTLLTNATETAALLIPTDGTFSSTQCDFTFTLDRARYRAAVPDADSDYRATATWHVTVAPGP
jgi:hypothetical protein